MMFPAGMVWAGPQDGQVAAGSATISHTGPRTDISQSSDRAVINWRDFSIGEGETVQFIQPSSRAVTLNRVTGAESSRLAGELLANGHVMLVNPNGIAFTSTAKIDVGSLTASTADIADTDFMAGRYVFGDAPANSSIINAGRITVRDAGLVALVAPHVRNSGVIEARLGTVELAAARGFTLDLYGDQLISFRLEDRVAETLKAADGRPLEALVSNDGTIEANGGRVYLTAHAAREVVNQSINTSGIVRAQSVAQDGGAIVLSGPGTVYVSGKLDASGAHVGARGGEVKVLGRQVGLMAGARVEASGDAGGGTVLIGGNWQGKGPEQNAEATYMDQNATIQADASSHGDGGTVVLWSNHYTGFYGSIYARGGARGGNGGAVETSSHDNLQAFGHVNASAAHGLAGNWLLDPTDVTIVSGSTNANITAGGGVFDPDGSTGAQIGVDNINTNLNAGTSVTINTASVGTEAGDITLSAGAAISKTAGGAASLTMNATGAIVLNSSITSSSGALATTLNAAGGAISSTAAINTNGGLLTLNAASGSGTLSGVISGTGGLTKTGAGTTVLSANNTFSGPTTVDGGMLQVGTGAITGTLGTSAATVNAAGTLRWFRSNANLTVANSVSGTGTLEFLGTGATSASDYILGGNNSGFTGSVVIDRARLRYDNANDLGAAAVITVLSGGQLYAQTAISNTLNLNGMGWAEVNSTTRFGALRLQNGAIASGDINLQSDSRITAFASTGTVSGVISGSSALEVSGGQSGGGGIGTLTLSGANTFTGRLTIRHGTNAIDTASLILAPTGSLATTDVRIGTAAASGAPMNTFAVLQTQGTNQLPNAVVSFDGLGVSSRWAYWQLLGTNQSVAGINDTSTHGVIENTENLPGFGNATLTLTGSGNYSYNGTMRDKISGDSGTLSLVKDGTGTQTISSDTNFTGTTTINAGTLQVGAGGTAGRLGTGAITNNANLVFDRSNALTVANTIGGTGTLTQAGTGTTTLTGTNTYSGLTAVNAGTLAITNPEALGSTSGGTTVELGATLDLQNVAVGAETVTLNGGRIATSTGTSSLSGDVVISAVGSVSVAGTQLTLSGVVSGGSGSLTKTGTGTAILSGSNTYDGVTWVSAGTLAITNNAGLGSTAGGTIIQVSGTLDLRDVAIGAESISLSGGTLATTAGNSSLAGNITPSGFVPRLDVAGGSQLTVSGNFIGGGSGTNLTKLGAGTVIFSGTSNTSPGLTTVSAGTLQVGDGGTTGSLSAGAVSVASGANLVFNRSDTVSLSALASNAGGITGAGNVTALIGGDFTVDRPIALNGANSAILLEAGTNIAAGDVSGGDVTLTSNVSTSATGTITIFSGHATTDAYEAMISGATGATRYKTYGADASDTSGAVTGTRNYYYREQPGTLTVSGLTATKVYDGLIDATTALDGSSATFNGLIDGDSMTFGSLTLLDATFDSAHAGARSVSASFSGAAPTYTGGGAGWSVSGYAPSTMAGSGTGSITPKALTTSINAVGKTYDGTTSTTSTLGTLAGFIGNDSASGASGLTLTFDNPNAGTRNVVATGSGTVAGFTGTASGNGSGVGAGNEVAGLASDYVVATPASASAVIGQAPLIVTANHDAKIVTQSDVSGYNGVSFDGFVNGEGVGNLSGSLSITRSNAGTEAAGTYNGVLLPTGYTSGNYAITYQAGDYRILPAQELLVKVSNVTDTYGSAANYVVTSAQYLAGDGSTLHTLTQTARNGNTYTFSDGVGGSVTFTVTPSGAVISGAGQLVVGNYALTGGSTAIQGSNFSGLHFVGNRAVTPAGLTLSAGGVSKVYDGTTAMSGLTLAQIGALTGDLVWADGEGAFDSKNAGINVGYTLSNLVLNGADAGNYYLTTGGTFSGTDGVITPRSITATGVAANDKIYDGTTAATLTLASAGLTNVVGGDIVSLDGSGSTASFADKNAGTGKAVALTGLGLAGADAGNYTLVQPTGLTANITPKAVSVTGVTANNKVYDGTTAATVGTGSASLSGIIAGDTVAIDGSNTTAAFADKNVGTGKLVMLTGLGLTGADAGNYTVTSSASATADITPRAISASGVVANHKVYDGTTAATLSFAGFDAGGVVAGDDVHLGDYLASFADKNVGTAKTVTVSGLGLAGVDAGNYTFTAPTSFAADITPKALSLTGVVANDKVYDGTTGATLTITGPGLAGIVAGDTVTLNPGNATAQFADSNAGTGKSVLVTGLGVSGADAGNYTLGSSGGLTASITPRAITLTADAAGKVAGAADPALSVSITGGSLASGDTLAGVTGELLREAGEAVGLYDILLGQGSRASNYAITFNADNDAFSIAWPARLGPVHAAGSVVAEQRRNDWPDALLVRDGTELVEPGLYEWRKDWRLLVAESLGRGDSAGQLADNVLHRIDRLVERSGFSSNNVQWREESL